ncbi:hypothetical protein [Naumannella halotolerans]|uniref:Uncharacterized protein n=1 Tax=Naumannella halotolerans TaxID=993414 RepID=A0A4R7J1T8_9ACTN|nr:hypothetical protein [Naumannella halotolerans]TDT31122.1 hypothetical protein CLV29_2535 [Naumannella halotolerans]
MSDQSYLDYLREEADGAEGKLFLETDRVCPGAHDATQHRDGKPPWCKACGRTNRGVLIKDVTA